MQNALTKYGAGAVSASLRSGYYDRYKQVEESIATFKKKEAALPFPTGYGGNRGVLSDLL